MRIPAEAACYAGPRAEFVISRTSVASRLWRFWRPTTAVRRVLGIGRERSARQHIWTWAALAAGVALLAACGQTPQSALEPATPQARDSFDLLAFVFWAALAVFVLVEGVMVYALIRFRRRKGDGIPRQTHGNTSLEIAWTIAPTILIAVVAALTFRTMFVLAQPPADNALQVRAIGHQWWFEIRYPDHGVVTANEIHVPVGRDTVFQLESVDVIHSFWVPQLHGKRDMVPGRVTSITIHPEETGIYLGQCAEFCGIAHANMRFKVVVDTPEDFDAWVANELRDAVPPETDEQRAGGALLTSGGCIACHTIRGTIAQGVIGPDLTHVGGRLDIAAGLMPNNPQNLAKWLHNPQAMKPGAFMVMPRQLSQDEIEVLAAYLTGLK